jgi:hypothetical protein
VPGGEGVACSASNDESGNDVGISSLPGIHTSDVRTTGTFARGIIYLLAAEFELTGKFSGRFAEGQIIVHRFRATGNIDVELQYREYGDMHGPAVWLIG